MNCESKVNTQDVLDQNVAPSLEEEVRSRLERMQPLRPTVDRIDPEDTAVVTFGEVLEEAIAHYASFDPPLNRMPDFLLVDWEGDKTSPWSALAEKHHVRVLPLSQRDSLKQSHLCAYARQGELFWERYGYYTLFYALRDNGINNFHVDRTVFNDQAKRPEYSEYISERFHDIIKIYAALADDESKESYLRSIKSLMTGLCDYVYVAEYPQYQHPIVHVLPGDVVIEGGLETENTTLSIAKQVLPFGKVIGFEPLSCFAEDSRKKVKNFSNVYIEQLGLWSEENTFYIENKGGSSKLVGMYSDGAEECHSIDIDTYLFRRGERCSCIKLDIEGAEVECLKGALQTLHHYRPKLMISLYHDKSHYIDIPLMLMEANLGYTFYVGHHHPYLIETVLYALPQKGYVASEIPLGQENERLVKNSATASVKTQAAMVTIFTLPKAFSGHTGMIQHNAIQSWLRMDPKPEVILLGQDPGVAEYAAEHGLRHCPDIKCNQYGTPLISSIYERGQALATTPYVAYVNTDIILDRLTEAVLSKNLPERFLLVGRRTDLMVWDPIDFDAPDWLEKIKNDAARDGLLYTVWGIDYFLFNKGLFENVPPFAVGKAGWDNWMLAHAKVLGVPLIDATRAVFALHQEHDYGHTPGGYTDVFRSKEAEANRALLGKYEVLHLGAADHCLEDGCVLPFKEAYSLPANEHRDLVVLCWQHKIAQQAAIRGNYDLYRSKQKVIEIYSEKIRMEDVAPFHNFKKEYYIGNIPDDVITLPDTSVLSTKDEIFARLNRMKPLRVTVDTVDSKRMAIVLYEQALEEALNHYSLRNTTTQSMPNFVVLNPHSVAGIVWDEIEKKYNTKIVGWEQRASLQQNELCVYAVPHAEYYYHPYNFELVILFLHAQDIECFYIDATVIACVYKKSICGYVEKNIDDICIIYSALADAESRDVFLRCLKTIETGDAGYIPIARYPHYHHPRVPFLPCDVVCEGGAGTGDTTQKIVQEISPEGRVYAFEPNSKRYAHLCSTFDEKSSMHFEPAGLWKECSSAMLSDEGSASTVLGASDATGAEKIELVSLDSFLAKRHERCDHIKLDVEGAEYETLQGAMHTIRYYRPKMQISIYHPIGDTYIVFLRIPLLLLKENLGYKFYMGHHGAWCYETVLYVEPPVCEDALAVPVALENSVDFSVIIYARNAQATLERCLDSVLIQSGVSKEVIVVDDASEDGTSDILARYASVCPMLRSVRSQERQGSSALDMALHMSTGKFVSFVGCNEVLDAHFLETGLALMSEGAQGARPEVLVCDVVTFDPQRGEACVGLQPCVMAHEEGLDAFLSGKLGSLSLSGKIFDRVYLGRFKIGFEGLFAFGDVHFLVRAFYHARSVRIADCVALFRYEHESVVRICETRDAEAFLRCVNSVERFLRAHSLDPEGEAWNMAVRSLYVENRHALCHVLQSALNVGVDHVLAEESMRGLGVSSVLLRLLLDDYATLICRKNGLTPQVLPEHSHWELEEAKPHLPKTYSPYGQADVFKATAPALSVIIPNYNKVQYLRECLDSVLSQSMRDFEIIIVDDASTDESYELLSDYADKDDRIRLYRMDNNSMQGVCRNIGISLARSEFITFVDSDDWIEANFFNQGINMMRNECADIVAFDVIYSKEDENFSKSKMGIYKSGGIFSVELLHSGAIPWGPCGKIYRTSFLREKNIVFPEYIFHQDAVFLVDAFSASRVCVTSLQCAYRVRMVEGSSCRPLHYTYKNLYTEWRYLFLWAEKNANNMGTIIWTIENYLLPVLMAFKQATGRIPLPYVSHATCRVTQVLHGLICGFSSLFCNSPDGHAFLVQKTQKDFVAFQQKAVSCPYVTVIIPTFNHEALISKCIDTVLSSSLRSLEVIVVNDASNDRTLEICNQYACKDARIRVLTNERNRGQGFGRNEAQRLARGRYISFVDSDDRMLPDFLLHAVAVLENNLRASWFKGSYEISYVDGHVENVNFKDSVYAGKIALRERVFDRLPIYTIWGSLFRTDFLRDNNICFPEHFFEDCPFLFKAMCCAEYIVLSSRICYRYCNTVHAASTMNPVRQGYRHLSGAIAHGRGKAEVLNAYPEMMDLETRSHKATLWHFDRALSYIQDCGDYLEPLRSEDLNNLRAIPIFFRVLMEAYAKIFVEENNISISEPSAKTDLRPQVSESPRLRLFAFHPAPQNVRISVIIPAYKVEKYLAQCLDSILAQGVAGVEILLVDDCSPDGTLTLAMRYARTHACIRLFQTSRNCGQGVVRNLATHEAKGEYISYVDADDYLEPYFLQRGLREMENDDECDMAVFAHRCDGGDNRVLLIGEGRVSGETVLAAHCTGRLPHWNVWGILFKACFLANNSLTFESGLYEDVAFVFAMYASARWVRLVPQVGYVYRVSGFSSAIRPRQVGQRHLHGMLSFVAYHTVFLRKYPHLNHIKKEIDTRMYRIWLYEFREKILPYVHACVVSNRPSPLTKEVLATLCASDALLRAIVKDYAELYLKHEAPKHVGDRHGHKPGQQAGKGQGTSASQQFQSGSVAQKSLAIQAKDCLGMGSLFERLLWRISPKRACIKALRRSRMFDADYYRQTNPDVAQSGVDPVYHYVHFGAAEGRNPAPWFNTYAYIAKNPDVAASGANAFYHYLRYGHVEKRSPGGQNATMGLRQIPSLDMGPLFERALWHIAPKRACIRALRRSGLVDTNYYRQTNPDVAQTGVDPAYHYVHFGAAEGRNPAPWFDTRSYVSNNPDVAASGANAFYHFLRYGHKEGRRPK